MSDKIALITGANKGIGLETARQLAQKGYMVLIGARDQERGEKAVQALCDEGLQARFVLLDLNDKATIDAATQSVEAQFSHLDVLVNNAGVFQDDSAPSEVSEKVLRDTYATNVFAPVFVTQAFLPLLKKSQAGRIVNVSSTLGSLGDQSDTSSDFYGANVLAYNSSKSALNMITVSFAKDLRDTPIKVNAVCPGYVATDINGHSGPRTVQQGATASVRYATLPDDGPSGGFFDEDGPVAW
jgi:NAD(P)-dependent dehydrogenase (short-subunit alcohol dehydrogenase family)